MPYLRLIAIGCFAFIATGASATDWWSGVHEKHVYLEGRPYDSAEQESDADFRATCGSDGTVELRVGATLGIGEGRGEAVAATLQSGGVKVELQGKSRWSVDSEMTGGTELTMTAPLDHPVFSVLQTGKPITLLSGGKKTSLSGRKAASAAKAFLDKCGRKR